MSIEMQRSYWGRRISPQRLAIGDVVPVTDTIVNPEPPAYAFNGLTDFHQSYNHVIRVVSGENAISGLAIEPDPKFVALCKRLSGERKVIFPPLFGEDINTYLGRIRFKREGKLGMKVIFRYTPDESK